MIIKEHLWAKLIMGYRIIRSTIETDLILVGSASFSLPILLTELV